MSRRGSSVAGLLVGGLALAGVSCSSSAWVHPRPVQEPTSSEVAELQARVLDLQRQAAVTQVELERLRQEVARLEARSGVAPGTGSLAPASSGGSAGAASAPSASGHAEGNFEVEDLTDEARHARATPGTPPGTASRTAAAPAPPPGPPRAVEESPAPGPRPQAPRQSTATVTPAEPEPEATPAQGAAGNGISSVAQSLYDRGYTLYHQGRFLDAEASFQRFIQAYPDTELTDNAQYWIGECRFSRGDTKGALAAFQETARRYPEGNKVPDALLKAGESMAKLGDVEGARKAYQDVKKRFPGTTAAAVADDRLAALP